MIASLSHILRLIKSRGLWYVLTKGYDLTMNHIVFKLFHNYLTPRVDEFAKHSRGIYVDPFMILGDFLGLDTHELTNLWFEFDDVYTNLQNRVRHVKLNYPNEMDLNTKSLFITYCVVRKIKPDIVLETGVANGVSTFVILKALKKNRRGKLISIDINSDVGILVSNELKDIWELRVMKRISPYEFTKIIRDLDKIDVFLHDSDHSYRWQSLEYNTVYPLLLKGEGILLSDDVHLSYAFIDFIKNKNVSPSKVYVLLDERKLFGMLKLK